jgi:nitroreductase
MNFLDLARKRQSERNYDGSRPVPREVLERCLEAARLAPSACNSQPWSFIVVDDPQLRDTLAEQALTGLHSMNSFAKKAPVLVVVVTYRSKWFAHLAGRVRGIQYNLLDVGCACEHLILQAAEEGVGSCWLGWFNERAVRRVLHLPATAKVDVIISLGYPAREEWREKKRKSLDEIRQYNI